MFAGRFFGARYFARRYFGKFGFASVFVRSPRYVATAGELRGVALAAAARLVQVAGESRAVIAVDDGRSAEPGSS